MIVAHTKVLVDAPELRFRYQYEVLNSIANRFTEARIMQHILTSWNKKFDIQPSFTINTYTSGMGELVLSIKTDGKIDGEQIVDFTETINKFIIAAFKEHVESKGNSWAGVMAVEYTQPLSQKNMDNKWEIVTSKEDDWYVKIKDVTKDSEEENVKQK